VVEETLAQNHRRNMGGDDPSISAQTRFLTADYLMWTIAEGGKPFDTDMPAFKNLLTAKQIWQIITYMRAGFPG
jgi:mono/diheme cytochrome c family protein